MFENNRLTKLLNIAYPIIQGGMVWISGWKLASAVSNAGGLGVIGAGSMNPALLLEHIHKCKNATKKPFAVNIPLIYKHSEEFVRICIEEKIPIIITSAGNPKLFTEILKKENIKVLHVVSNTTFAQKAEQAGVDAVIAEGFEAGGHNGREETTTMVLVPIIAKSVKIPVIAAGGIATGSQMLAAFALGAEGVQIGTRFITTFESSAHDNFKNIILKAKEGDTMLTLKKSIPTRMLKNKLYYQIENAENSGYNSEQIKQMLGEGENKAQIGMFLGDIENGMLEAGQNVCLISKILSVKETIEEILNDFENSRSKLCNN